MRHWRQRYPRGGTRQYRSERFRSQAPLAPFEKETFVTTAVIVTTARDRAVTAKERSRSPIGTCL